MASKLNAVEVNVLVFDEFENRTNELKVHYDDPEVGLESFQNLLKDHASQGEVHPDLPDHVQVVELHGGGAKVAWKIEYRTQEVA